MQKENLNGEMELSLFQNKGVGSMTIMPFICIGTGVFIGINKFFCIDMNLVDIIINLALFLLMFTIGLNIGLNQIILNNIGTIGINCLVISILAILFSAIFTFLIENRYINLNNFLDNDKKIKVKDTDVNGKLLSEFSLIPIFIIIGLFFGIFMLKKGIHITTDLLLWISLIILYTGVGISLSKNRDVFGYIKKLGWKIMLIPCTTIVGSLFAGWVSAWLLKLPLEVTLLSSSGMSYYSVTGAYMSQTYGAEIGIYGFLVNVFREFFVVLGLPIIHKLGNGAVIAAGAAGNMDTMLIPVTKYTGKQLILVTLVTGTTLTFLVPIILPLLSIILKILD